MVGRLSSASGEDERRLRGQLNDPAFLSAPKSSDEPIFRNRVLLLKSTIFFEKFDRIDCCLIFISEHDTYF